MTADCKWQNLPGGQRFQVKTASGDEPLHQREQHRATQEAKA